MKKQFMMGAMMMLMAVSLFFLIQGSIMHYNVDAEESRFHSLQKEYFTLDKATRESAPTGSELNAQLVEIQNYPSELLKLKLVGVGKILTGIYVLLFGILIALIMMPIRLGKIIKEKDQ
jgi:hypothetical protein